MASIILASIALGLTLLVYVFGAWRFFRFPRFWVTFARANVISPSGESPRALQDVFVAVAYRGGGQPRNIIDVGFLLIEEEGSRRITRASGGWVGEVISIPSELAGRFNVEPPSGLATDSTSDEMSCCLRLDCGGEYFDVPFTLRGPGEVWHYFPSALTTRMMSARLPRTWLQRLLDWIRSR
jgi:hypothetical protein